MRALYLGILLLLALNLVSQTDPEHLMDLSLEEILNLEIDSGTLTGVERIRVPVSLSVITQRDIATTPARNLLDILEVYVPGFTFVEHYNGPRLGIRGILGDQNYTWLLLVNGRNLGVKYAHGILHEFKNHDLHDIERIEVVRGPGSVIYGPGAIAGVINIITLPEKPFNPGMGIDIDLDYQSQTVWGKAETGDSETQAAIYGSYSRTKGLDDTRFWYTDRAHGYGYGFMSPDWGDQGLGSKAPDFWGDYLEEPEYKVQVSGKLPGNIEYWVRSVAHTQTYVIQASKSSEGDAWRGNLVRNLVTQLNHEISWGGGWTLSNRLGYRSTSLREINLWQGEDLSIEHIAQRSQSFSENEWMLESILRYEYSSDFSFAFGASALYEYYSPEWGLDDDTFILSLPAPIRFAVLTEDSGFHKFYGDMGLTTVIDGDIDGTMTSIFGEVNMCVHPRFQTLISGRLDMHEYAEPAFSPRIALISSLNDRNIIKLLGQQSVRLPLFSELYLENYASGSASEFERLSSVELSYHHLYDESLTLSGTCFFNAHDQFAWIEEKRGSGLFGYFESLGFEGEMLFAEQPFQMGLNYTLIEQLSWDGEYQTNAWITGLDGEEITLEDNAENRINNLPRHSLKAHVLYEINPTLLLHADGRLYLDFQQNVMMDLFEEAHQKYGNPETLNYMHQLRADMEDHGYGQPSFTTNFSLKWRFQGFDTETALSFYVMNLLQYNHIRYVIQYWEQGNLRQYPRQCGFIEEPVTVGMKFSVELPALLE